MEWSGREDELWMLPLHTFAVLMNSGLLVMCFQPSYSLNFSSLFIPSLINQIKGRASLFSCVTAKELMKQNKKGMELINSVD